MMRRLLLAATLLSTGLSAPLLADSAQTSVAGRDPAAAKPSTAGWRVVHEGKIKYITVTNPDTGEQGCHNHQTQTSEPGPCPAQ